jgi:DNA replication ATP-dependent helicase Dna2
VAQIYEGGISSPNLRRKQAINEKQFLRSNIDYNFFKEYDRILHAQETGMIHDTRNFEIWTIPAVEREMYGTCLSDMLIDTSYVNDELSPSRLYKYEYRLKRSPLSTQNIPLNDAGRLSSGAAIVVSSGRQVAAAVGFVISLDPDTIVIRVDQRLPRQKLSGFESLEGHPDVWVYRIDLEDMFSDLAGLRNLLLRQLEPSDDRDTRLRSLIVDLQEPRFQVQGPDKLLTRRIQTVDPKIASSHLKIVERLLCAQDYVLLRIRQPVDEAKILYALIHSIIETDQKILLVGANHEMIDNLLLENMPMKEIVRLGSPAKVSS